MGECYLSVCIPTAHAQMELRNIKFHILQTLSVPVLLGCEVLSALRFQLTPTQAVFRDNSVPRIVSLMEKMPFICTAKLQNSVVVRTDTPEHWTVAEVELSWGNATPPPAGVYTVNIGDLDLANLEMMPVNRDYISRPCIRVTRFGELQPKRCLLTFGYGITDFPKDMISTLRRMKTKVKRKISKS